VDFVGLYCIIRWYVHHTATWTRETAKVPWTSELSSWEHTVHYEDWERRRTAFSLNWYVQETWWIS